VELAYSQPYVGAFFDFLLEDEPDPAGANGHAAGRHGPGRQVPDHARRRLRARRRRTQTLISPSFSVG
jgi:hypothetical protein